MSKRDKVELEEVTDLLNNTILERGHFETEDLNLTIKGITILSIDVTSQSLITYVIQYKDRYYKCNIVYDSYDQYVNCEDIFEVEPILTYVTVYEPIS